MNGNDSAQEITHLGCCPTTLLASTSDHTLLGSYGIENGSSTTQSSPSSLHLYEVRVPLGVLESLVALGAVVGNILVIMSVYTNRKLRTITNLFVVSLAFSDLMVGLLVLPFAIKQEITEAWGLGSHFCSIFITLDVLLCTASILNLCCISIDRYCAITRPLACATKRSKRLALLMIGAVWVLSVIITIPPLLGWSEPNRKNDGSVGNACKLIEEKNYVIYSALGSFYIPLAVMLFVYANIFVVARNAQRRWRHSSSKGGSSLRSSKPGSTSQGPGGAAPSPNISGEEEDRGSPAEGVRPRVKRVMSVASDTVCCGCFGRGQWTGTYSLTVTDDWRLSPGVVAESCNRQTTTGFDIPKRSILIYGGRPCSMRHDPRSCSSEHGRRCCSQERDSGLCPARPYSHLLGLGSDAKIETVSETRKFSSESETKLSEMRPAAKLSLTESEAGTGPCDEVTAALPAHTRPGGTPSEPLTKQSSDVSAQKEHSPPNTHRFTSTIFSWTRRRRHSSLDCVCDKRAINSGEDQGGEVFCNRFLIARHSDSLPTRLMRDRAVSITTSTTTTTTTPSTGSRGSSGSEGSGDSAGGHCVSPQVKIPSVTRTASIDRASNRPQSALPFESGAAPRNDGVLCKTKVESIGVASPEQDAALNGNSSYIRSRGPDANLVESPGRRPATRELSASFRSVRRGPLQHNTEAHPRPYGSFGDVMMTPTMARQISHPGQKSTRDRRENSVVFRESKTVKTVSIVIGCFVLCWLPFFVVYISAPFLANPFDVNRYLDQFVTWLGYFNSLINPFIYAFYNYEFRSTFWQLTIGRVWKGRRRLPPRVVAPSSPLNHILRYQTTIRNNSVIVLNRLTATR